MKTLTNIKAIAGNVERSYFFVRPYSAKKPTFAGAARMVARAFNEEHGTELRPSEIIVSRIEHCDYRTPKP